MNYAQARQIKEGPNAGKWHWTIRNDNMVRSEGYCSPWEECPDCHGKSSIFFAGDEAQPCSWCDSKGIVRKEQPCSGHDTAEEAEEHFRQYQIDRAEFIEIKDADAQMLGRCRMCDKHTASYMRIKGDGYRHDLVCPEHHERKTAEFLIERTSAVMHS